MLAIVPVDKYTEMRLILRNSNSVTDNQGLSSVLVKAYVNVLPSTAFSGPKDLKLSQVDEEAAVAWYATFSE